MSVLLLRLFDRGPKGPSMWRRFCPCVTVLLVAIARRARCFVTSTGPHRFRTLGRPGSFFGIDGGMVSKVLDNFAKGSAPPPPQSFDDKAPSWQELQELLSSMQTPEERELPYLIAKGRGPTSCKANLRLFDAADDYQPRVTLYRDHAGWCPYCEKVWLQLEEKRIPYRVEKVPMRCYGDKPGSFSRISPSGMIPVASIDGQLISESNDIMFALEDMFPAHKPLLPPTSEPKSKDVTPLLRLEREIFGAWLRWLTNPPQVDSTQRRNFENVLGRVNDELLKRGGPYFLGDDISLVDCFFAPFLERMAASLMFYKGFDVRSKDRYPGVASWFAAMEHRPTFANIKSDYWTHAQALPPQIGGCYSTPEGVRFEREISGRDGSWALPLRDDGCEPMNQFDEMTSRREAAAQLIGNRNPVAKFCCRPLGSTGRPVGARLSDPHAAPNLDYVPLMDTALRSVAAALLKGTEQAEVTVFDREVGPRVAVGLEYLRDRVGVPRDLSYEAARQLRAHLSWVSEKLRA